MQSGGEGTHLGSAKPSTRMKEILSPLCAVNSGQGTRIRVSRLNASIQATSALMWAGEERELTLRRNANRRPSMVSTRKVTFRP
jgi:hypothetical protein